jgi:hypothetical protein
LPSKRLVLLDFFSLDMGFDENSQKSQNSKFMGES